MKNKLDQILVIDSGIGGLSVLKELISLLPNEDYVYFGDSKNVPYGEKKEEAVLNLSITNISNLLKEYDCKACVLACNTLSVYCLDELKEHFKDLIFIETVPNYLEPLKDYKTGDVLVISTPLTSSSKYFDNIKEKRVIPLGMPGLAKIIEDSKYDEESLFSYFDSFLFNHLNENVKAISLGCTHYPFIKDELNKYLELKGFDIKLYDSSKVTGIHLLSELKNHNLLNDKDVEGDITILNSILDDKIIEKSFELLERWKH